MKDFVKSTILSLLFCLPALAEVPSLASAETPDYIVHVINPVGNCLFEGVLQEMNHHGTGSIIRKDLILTAYHVIEGNVKDKTLFVVFKGGSIIAADLIKKDEPQDLALLRIKGTNFKPIKVCQGSLSVGENITLGGFALHVEYKELRTRIERFCFIENMGISTFFWSYGQCAKGMSGGPATNSKGELVGILYGAGPEYTMGPDLVPINNFLKEFDFPDIDVILE